MTRRWLRTLACRHVSTPSPAGNLSCWPLVCCAGEFQQPALLLQVALCEPLTDLQRRGEFMSYSELLDQVPCMAPQMRICSRITLCHKMHLLQN